jgi:hypothetical protein
MTTYTATRAAEAEIATSLVTLGSGAMAVKQLTPGVATLAPTLAGVLAQQAAIASPKRKKAIIRFSAGADAFRGYLARIFGECLWRPFA